jgi:membrane protease YdiL (CAAX protease family)
MQQYFNRIENFRYNRVSVVQFVFLCLTIWTLNVMVQQIFPTENNFPFLIRNIFAAITVLLLSIGTKILLKKNNVSDDVLGLCFSFKTLVNILLGLLLAVVVLFLIGLFVYVFVPFHFEPDLLSGTNALKHTCDYFWTNALEELIFRGFPLIVLSKMYGWRKAVWFLALPFGLFHLYGLGLGIAGIKMMLTTTTIYSFVFCYAYILTDSLITASCQYSKLGRIFY